MVRKSKWREKKHPNVVLTIFIASHFLPTKTLPKQILTDEITPASPTGPAGVGWSTKEPRPCKTRSRKGVVKQAMKAFTNL